MAPVEPPHLPRFPSPCRARVRWQAHTVSQAHGMPCEAPAQPPWGSLKPTANPWAHPAATGGNLPDRPRSDQA